MTISPPNCRAPAWSIPSAPGSVHEGTHPSATITQGPPPTARCRTDMRRTACESNRGGPTQAHHRGRAQAIGERPDHRPRDRRRERSNHLRLGSARGTTASVGSPRCRRRRTVARLPGQPIGEVTMRGSVLKRCACPPTHDAAGRRKASPRRHGSWFFIADVGEDPRTRKRSSAAASEPKTRPSRLDRATSNRSSTTAGPMIGACSSESGRPNGWTARNEPRPFVPRR